MCMRHNAIVQHYVRAVYIMPCTRLHFLPYYDLFMAARSALSQPCSRHWMACMQVCMPWKITKSGAAGGEQSEPPCLYMLSCITVHAQAQYTCS